MSPGAIERLAWYGHSPEDIAYARFGGLLDYTGETDVFNVYQGYFEQLAEQDTPFSIDLSFDFDAAGNIILDAGIELAENTINQENKVFFVLTNHNNTNYSSTVVARSENYDLNITQAGDTALLSSTIIRDSLWNISNFRAVAIIQSWETKEILQSAQVPFTGLLPAFVSNIQSGPASLLVRFTNQSLPAAEIDNYQWDFDGDGSFDSEEINPVHLYDTPGTYDIILRVSTADQSRELTFPEYIFVNASQTASGSVSGIWQSDNSPYTIRDSITINAGDRLVIEPGVDILCYEGIRIIVQGSLLANAADADSISFYSTNSWQGIFFQNSDQPDTLSNCRISNCNLSAIQIDNSTVTVSNSILSNNNSSASGAALHITNSTDVEIRSNIIANNSCSDNGHIIYLFQSDPLIANNIIVNNSSEYYGSITMDSGSNAYLLNNTIAYNLGVNSSIYINNCFPLIRNCLIWEPGAIFNLVNGAPSVSYSCISGGYTGTGNISTAPLFQNPTAGSGSEYNGLDACWIVQSNSPCIDAGNNGEAYYDIEDPQSPGWALYPAQGSLINDIGAYGGKGNSYTGHTDAEENEITPLQNNSLIAFPNPFNPTTTFSFELTTQEAAAQICLDIFNCKGQLVKKLYTGYTTPGKNLYTWNATNNQNHSLSSGIYFARLKTLNGNTITPILLLK
ncbi:MAG: right-handed parallel beta-helix repeat-containing protein [Candidatus Cloacimonetes bacterium]|nr:right-handed parallel beta-helix repeat-containing protein [Candidatus Cloacimonadota bacterium]